MDFGLLDKRFVWHPFTQMRDWLRRDPIVITSGKGAVLRDTRGRVYLDANSSIWTNLHGHRHPAINRSIQQQLGKISHSSALGLANQPASILAARLIAISNGPRSTTTRSNLDRKNGKNGLAKVFFSDDGATAVEVALKLAYEYARRSGFSRKPKFVSVASGYHGDTIGAVALGHSPLFHKNYAGLLFKTDAVMAPYCYRCPFNRAKPERQDARTYRKCNWECVDVVARKFRTRKRTGSPYAAFVFEPLIQGAAGMIPQPAGWLRQVTGIARQHGALLIADEVMTGFGRCGVTADGATPGLLACQHEGVRPDLLCLAKGLTGGYLPMAATLVRQPVFDAFLGNYFEFKTFFHGHSYTANQLGAAAALASLDLLQHRRAVATRARLQKDLGRALETLWSLPQVGDIRQVGLIAGIELVRDWRTREPIDLREQAGIRVCQAMAERGVLTRPIGNVIVLMPPYCTTPAQLNRMVETLSAAIRTTLGR